MRNKYRNRLDMYKTGGNAIRLELTDLQPALKNLQIKARGKVAEVGTRTVEPELKFRAPAPAASIRHFSLRLHHSRSGSISRSGSTIQIFLAPAPQSWLEPTAFGND